MTSITFLNILSSSYRSVKLNENLYLKKITYEGRRTTHHLSQRKDLAARSHGGHQSQPRELS